MCASVQKLTLASMVASIRHFCNVNNVVFVRYSVRPSTHTQCLSTVHYIFTWISVCVRLCTKYIKHLLQIYAFWDTPDESFVSQMSKTLYEQFKIWKSIFIWQYLRQSDLLASVVTIQHSLCICCSSETKGSYANLPQSPKPYPFSTRNINTQLRPTAEKETEKLFCPLKQDYGQLPKRKRKKEIPQRITK